MAISSLTNVWNSVSLEKEDISAKTCATRLYVAGTAVHGLEDELGQDHDDHDLVSIYSAFFGL